MNYCQDGLKVYFATDTQEYTYEQIYGHYELQPDDVNGRPYFKMGSYGLWWDGVSLWWIGYDSDKGQSYGFAFYDKDVFCPHQLSEFDWVLGDEEWFIAGNNLGINCKCIFIKNKNSLNYMLSKINAF